MGLSAEVRWIEAREWHAVLRRAEYTSVASAKRRARALRRTAGVSGVEVIVPLRMWHGGVEAWRAT